MQEFIKHANSDMCSFMCTRIYVLCANIADRAMIQFACNKISGNLNVKPLSCIFIRPQVKSSDLQNTNSSITSGKLHKVYSVVSVWRR